MGFETPLRNFEAMYWMFTFSEAACIYRYESAVTGNQWK